MDICAGRGGWAPRAALLAGVAVTLAACAGGPAPERTISRGEPATMRPYQVGGVWYYPKEQPRYEEIGIASWYGDQFHNHRTADGEVFDMNMPSAAHKTLPLPSLVEVTNLANGRILIVRVNDRGPFVGGRVIDLSRQAATQLGFMATGVTRVKVRYVGRADVQPLFRQPTAMAPRQTLISDPQPPPTRFLDEPAPVRAPAPVRPEPTAPSYATPAYAAPAPVVVAAAVPEPDVVQGLPPRELQHPASMQTAALAPVPAAGPPMPTPQPQGGSDEVDGLLTGASPPASSYAPAYAEAAPPVASYAPSYAQASAPAVQPAAAPVGAYELQAGAFSNPANAQRIAAGLAGAQVQPVERGGKTVYRVVVRGLPSADAAAAARSQAAALGVGDARVVAPGGA